MIFQFPDDPFFMLCAKGLHSNFQLHSRVPVCAYELIVIQTDDISLLPCNNGRHIHQLARFIRQKHRYGENTISLNQSVLHHRGHGNNIHIASA